MTEPPWVFIPPKPPMIDPAEFIALRVIVMGLVAEMANRAATDGAIAQTVVNELSIVCQDSLTNAAGMGDGLRTRALDHVNGILGSIIFPPSGDATN